MTNPDTSPILLDDYATLGSTLLATNLANNPGFETLGTPYAATNFYTYPSAARGDATGWDNGFGSNVKPSLVADATFPGGWAFTRTVTALTGIVMGTNSYVPATATNLTGAYLPAVTG